jgi:hypothetical protein
MSTTNGWDAVCAMSLPQVNALLFQQYLRHGPTSPAKPLRLILNVESQYWILDAVLGPPELSFNADSQTANLTMELVRGSLIALGSELNVQNAIRIRPKESRLTGLLSLARVDVKDTLGSLVADLGAGAYAPEIKGVDPDTVLNTTLGEAVQTYFANNDTTFPIGTVALVTGTPASLQPTDFKFATQKKLGSSDACVLLLIQTNGSAGAVQPLVDYPIPDNHTAALLISGQAVFSGLMVDYLNNGFASQTTTFQASQNNGAWMVVGHGGEVNFGQIGDPSSQQSVWSCDGPGMDGPKANPTPFVVPLDGFTVQTIANGLSVSLNVQHMCYWCQYAGIAPREGQVWYSGSATVQVTYSLKTQPVVDPVSDKVTFPGSAPVNVTQAGAPGWLASALQAFNIPDNIITGMQNILQPMFENFQLPSVNTFALASLLFPADHVISLSDVALPGDLNLTGSMVAPIAVTPATSAIVPGATVQFTAAVQASGDGGNDVLWEIQPQQGSISTSGLYTAPATIDEATVVVVTAVSQSDASQTGSAMVLVFESAAAQGVDVAPGSSVVTPGQTVMLSCADSSGNPLAVTWTLSPKGFGQITAPPLSSAGQYIYTAPATIDGATEVTVTATVKANTAQTGSAVIQVTPTATVTVTPSSTTAAPGATIPLTATVSSGDPDDLAWVVYPIGAGTVAADQNDASKAAYTAPDPAGTNEQASVVAYLVDDQAVGLGVAVITLNS